MSDTEPVWICLNRCFDRELHGIKRGHFWQRNPHAYQYLRLGVLRSVLNPAPLRRVPRQAGSSESPSKDTRRP